MNRLAAALGVTIGLMTAMSANAGTVPPPVSQETIKPHPASDRPLINRPNSTDPFWEQQRTDGP